MATKEGAMSAAALRTAIKSAVQVPKFLLVITVDGRAAFISAMDNYEEAAKEAVDPVRQKLFEPLANDGDGHHVRCVLQMVVDDAEPGIPASWRSVTAGIDVWEMKGNLRPKEMSKLNAPQTTAQAKAQLQARNGGTNGGAKKKTVTRKKTAKKATAKKTGSGGGPRKTATAKTTAGRRKTKTARRRTARR